MGATTLPSTQNATTVQSFHHRNGLGFSQLQSIGRLGFEAPLGLHPDVRRIPLERGEGITVSRSIFAFLFPTERNQNPTLLGSSNSLQLSVPVGNRAASLGGSVCKDSTECVSPFSSAWLPPSASAPSSPPLTGIAYGYQQSSTSMPSRISGPRQMSTSAASYPSSSERNRAGSTQVKSSSQGDLTVTALVHDPAVLSMSLAAWFDQISGGNHTVSRDPSHSARLTEATTSLIANQSPSLALPCQDWGRVDYCHQGTMGPFFSGEVGPCLQPYGSMISYPGGTGSASQTYINSPPEMIMVLKEIQPAFHQPPAYVPGVYYSVSALPMPGSSCQGE